MISKIIAHKITHYDGEKDFKGYRRFYIKYAKYIQDPVILGSLTHLMTDYYYNNITYTKKAIWDEKRKSIIGVKLNNGKQINVTRRARKLKEMILEYMQIMFIKIVNLKILNLMKKYYL